MLLFSCKKDKIEPQNDLKHFVFVDGFNRSLKVELTWKVNGFSDGYNYINCDLYVSDTSKMTENSFFQSTYVTKPNDWKGSPVLLSSLGKLNKSESIDFPRAPIQLNDTRKYIGVAVNGLGYLGSSLSGKVTIEYTFTITCEGAESQTINGSFIYNTSLASKTFVNYFATLDYQIQKNTYSFRLLQFPVTTIRNSDFTMGSVFNIDVSVKGALLNDFVVNMEWLVDNTPDYTSSAIDMDLYASGTDIQKSLNTDAFESILFDPSKINSDYYLGYNYYENFSPSFPSVSNTIKYRYVIYYEANPFFRYELEKTFVSPPAYPDTNINLDLIIVKSGFNITVTPI